MGLELLHPQCVSSSSDVRLTLLCNNFELLFIVGYVNIRYINIKFILLSILFNFHMNLKVRDTENFLLN